MEIIYGISTGTNETYKRKNYVEKIIPFLPRTTYIVKGKNETECRNLISAHIKSLYFDFEGEIAENFGFDNEIVKHMNISTTFMLTKRVDDEYYCRAIDVNAIRIVKDKICYL